MVRVCRKHTFIRNKVCLFLNYKLIASHSEHNGASEKLIYIWSMANFFNSRQFVPDRFNKVTFFFLVASGDETNKYFLVQCDRINSINKHFIIWLPISLYLLFFLYLFRTLARIFSDSAGERAPGIFFFKGCFTIKAHTKMCESYYVGNYPIPIMWILLYQISWSSRIVNKHRRTPWIKNDVTSVSLNWHSLR